MTKSTSLAAGLGPEFTPSPDDGELGLSESVHCVRVL